ncbi:MAG: UDP-N-acetylmuramoyl-L-alanyl-D-glutamate--2,6-diaminopimelate ligase [Phycisphaerales bacterium]
MRLADLLSSISAHPALKSEVGPSAVPTLLNQKNLPVSTLPGDIANTRICDITEDSRTVVPGSLFIARKGLKSDGKAFVDQALRAGAVAILTDDPSLTTTNTNVPVLHCKDALLASSLIGEVFHDNASRKLDLVGVTGTNGKTTTTFFIWQLLNAAKIRAGLIGTVMIDDGVEVARAHMTTPPAIEVSRTLARMHECGCTAAAMEVSSHALDQHRCDALRFKVAVFSNLTGDHLDYHKTMDNYAQAKARLFELLPSNGTALINANDPWSPRMVQNCKAKVLLLAVVAVPPTGEAGRCSSAERSPTEPTSTDHAKRVVGGTHGATNPDCTCIVHAQSMEGMDLTLQGPWGTFTTRSTLVGHYNAFNILAAVASAHALGCAPEHLKHAVSALRAPPGRLERVTTPTAPTQVFVDYAHSDDSLANVIAAVANVMPGRHAKAIEAAAGAPLASKRPGKLIVVFGCGGDRDKTKRPRMGKAAAELADHIIITSDNPRTEKPAAIVEDILAGIDKSLRHKVEVQVDRARAIKAAIEAGAPTPNTHPNVIIIAGKGHENEQILPDNKGGTISTHFDDYEVAATELATHNIPVERRFAFE